MKISTPCFNSISPSLCLLPFVADVLSNRKMLNILLKKKGIDCEMAEDGVIALDMVEKNPDRYDVIFMYVVASSCLIFDFLRSLSSLTYILLQYF